MKRLLVVLIPLFLLLAFPAVHAAPSGIPWEFNYTADNATFSTNNGIVEIYLENGVAYLSCNISDLTGGLQKGMKVVVNLTLQVSVESVSSGVKIIVGNDTMIQRSLNSGDFSLEFHSLHNYNATDKFTIVLYDYGGNINASLKGIYIEKLKGGVDEGLLLTGIGITVVFVVLSILALVMYVFKPKIKKKEEAIQVKVEKKEEKENDEPSIDS
jgi:Na+-transporting methylmalonyl-CoA/oxaloacetate decarboxylase gamma subunit